MVLNIEELIRLVLSTRGPRLVIMNTVQSAAVVADALARGLYGKDYLIKLETSKVLHLSTSLAPVDREVIVNVIKNRLRSVTDEGRDFTLVEQVVLKQVLTSLFVLHLGNALGRRI